MGEELTLEERVCALERCMYGDIKTGEPGMYNMVKEMYDLFTKSGWGIKFIIKLVLGIGAICGAIWTIIKLFKFF